MKSFINRYLYYFAVFTLLACSNQNEESQNSDTATTQDSDSLYENETNSDISDTSLEPDGVMSGIVEEHNSLRKTIKTTPSLLNLSWSDSLAEEARTWAETLAETMCGYLMHSNDPVNGENIFTAGQTSQLSWSSPKTVVQDAWGAEKLCWDYGTISESENCDINSCYSGCGHFTQIVWRDTKKLGCGVSSCVSDGWYYDIWVCKYFPPGNIIGQTPY
ncbi:MAG: hypothetical protein JXR91_12000 [Deltaproteobacteria bacterium]|nr:hypothetical protein [Deltaproteobacteria bacterium]